MKYKIEIWIYHSIRETYENDDIEEVLKWYKDNWQSCYDYGGCMFYLFKNNKKLPFEQVEELGFFN